ncbi:zinc ribbon domain-containing protein [Pedobacter cryoconitis]|uniref:Zn finger protein HypA/HybF involved in hydrogenase expression n=1 Tax=Pedobacter cryoconitis TaxID=188932 RepID=A0A7X0J8V4_9SPHI|nr:zinc ribbon domain-containing protein [Pedobacter cryoconitis]MBB6502809.1 Zn finger protein HypA/HybF involved in hydrogenase expression [Pedobacter cryoconitis]
MPTSLSGNIFNILFTIGMFLIGYTYLQTEKYSATHTALSRRVDTITDSISLQKEILDLELKNLILYSNRLSIEYHTENPIVDNDSLTKFKEVVSGNKNDVIVANKIKGNWDKYVLNQRISASETRKLNKTLKIINEDLNRSVKKYIIWIDLIPLGPALLVISTLGLMFGQIKQNALVNKQINEGRKNFKCQSCTKEFNATVQRAKFNDGEINEYYCNECFSNDDFIEPELTKELAFAKYISQRGITNKLGIWTAKQDFYRMRRWWYGKY